jgi:PAS domain S-box-containing protein
MGQPSQPLPAGQANTDLQAEVEMLQQQVRELQQINQEMQLTLETTVEHRDEIAAELSQTNERLQAEVVERQMAQATLQAVLETISHNKPDSETILNLSVQGDTVEYQLYKRAVETMRQSEELFRAIAEFSPIAMFITATPDGAIRYANAAAAQLLETESQALLQHTLHDFYQATTSEQLCQRALAAEAGINGYELQGFKPNGQPFWAIASVHTVPLQGEQAWLTTLYDIGERKRMEEALRQSEAKLQEQARLLRSVVEHREQQLRDSAEKYRSIFENAVEGIFQASPDGSFINANPALAAMYGYTSTEELMTTLTDLGKQLYVQPSRRAELLVFVNQFESVSDMESEVYRKDGSTIWVSESIRVVKDRDGKVLHYEGTVREVTEHKKIEAELRQQRVTSERLLLNVLPQKIAERLKRGSGKIAEHFSKVTVLFADIVNFTELADTVSPTELVDVLNEIFSSFDALVSRHGLEKIKTIGDAYMAVGGLPSPMPSHTEAIADLALGMQQEIRQFQRHDGQPFQLRIGIHTGPVIAGVIGFKKFAYDLWGDTVNVASRMEIHGEADKIQVTDAVYERLKHRYEFEQRGIISVKGKGEMVTYWLIGLKK